ncbi:protein enabled [Trichonephila clavata]|uniref:Protein enabled n=1 Tax=Trichonephila clavata TaxID=2740835 RepID=A0A8X6GPD2_TRICU|nr:protein enabled [Trichonephila clavata]
MSEQSVASARASVMVYDSTLKKWIPSGLSSGLSKVHIYHNVENNTFRVVGRKVQDHEVVINCSILKGLKYFQATPTFHQWRDNSQIHGLNFASRDDAETFALAMERVLDILGHSSMYLTTHRSSQSQPLYQTIGHSGVSLDDYAEYRGWMNNENGERKANSEYSHYRSTQANHSSHPNTPGSIPSPSIYSHHRGSSSPSVSQQPLSIVPQPQQPSPQSSVPPPPPPPPPPSNSSISGLATLPRLHLKPNPEQEVTETSLAAALATAKLKKTPSKQTMDLPGSENKQFPKGMACMLDEMTRTLARRRAQTDSSIDAESTSSGDSNRSWNKQNFGNACSPNVNSGGESPQSVHRSDVDSDNKNPVILDAVQIEKIKQDIVSEVRLVMNKVKQEIIDAVRMEMNRR